MYSRRQKFPHESKLYHVYIFSRTSLSCHPHETAISDVVIYNSQVLPKMFRRMIENHVGKYLFYSGGKEPMITLRVQSRRLFHPNSARYRGAFLFRALTRCRFSQYLPAGPPVCWRKAARINKNEKKKKIRKRKKEKKKKNMIFTTRR